MGRVGRGRDAQNAIPCQMAFSAHYFMGFVDECSVAWTVYGDPAHVELHVHGGPVIPGQHQPSNLRAQSRRHFFETLRPFAGASNAMDLGLPSAPEPI